jgi:tRNA-specific 2-thiouridylase
VLGQHEGIPFFTIGQRRGLGLATGRPLYVLEIDRASNRLVVGMNEELLDRHLWADHLNWVSVEAPKSPLHCQAQIRYAHRAAPMELLPLEEGGVRGTFQGPQRAVTPGQSVVFYDLEELLGGGVIRRPSAEEADAVRCARGSTVEGEG